MDFTASGLKISRLHLTGMWKLCIFIKHIHLLKEIIQYFLVHASGKGIFRKDEELGICLKKCQKLDPGFHIVSVIGVDFRILELVPHSSTSVLMCQDNLKT